MGSLILAVLTSGMVSIAMRLSEKRADNSMVKLSTNYLLCSLLSFAAMTTQGFGSQGSGFAVGLGSFNGLLFLAGLSMAQWSIRENGVVLSATFMKLGLLVPMTLSLILFRERPGLFQLIGVALALFAIVLINYRPGLTPSQLKWGLLALLLVEGSCSATSKVFREFGVAEREGLFLLCTFGTALILSASAAAIRREPITKWAVLYGLLIGIPNFFSSKFLLDALVTLPGVVVYPTYSVGSLLVVTVVGVAVFHERLDRRQSISLVLILIALALLNLTV